MDLDDLELKSKTSKPKNLEIMSIEALHEYISELEDEIIRVREEITAKEDARVGAESVFEK